MAEVEMSRKDLLLKLANVAFITLKTCSYHLREVATFLTAVAQEFDVTPDEQKIITMKLTELVINDSNSGVVGRRHSDKKQTP